jgi:adenine-specific DNA-methyltransferase
MEKKMNIKKLDLKSMDIVEEKREQLKALFPEAFTEGQKIDFERLKLTLGEMVDPGKERYGMNWPGKADCFKIIQQPSIAALTPARDESVDFDTTENLFIEGDNLEVLKLLQKSYFGNIKMIYIDPPYNTGNDFIYPDDYSESLDTYLRYTGQIDNEGRKYSTNTEADGRFHSKWMNMMYPRLFLARNLLQEDGVIFISIDDNELSNLRKLCDEIFGEENFIGLFIINSSPSAIDYGHIAKMHDYALFYAKALSEIVTSQLAEENKKFKYVDNVGSFNLYPLYNGNVAFNPKTRPNLFYPFYLNPSNKIADDFYEIGLEEKENWIAVYPVVSKKDGIQRVWRWSKELSRKNLNQEIVGYRTEDGEFRIVQKTRHTGKVIRSLQIDKDISTRRGTAEVESIFGKKMFPFPKSTELIKRFINVGMQKEDIILDFFAGAATTAHAILELNKKDGGNFKFIMVQLPEPTEENSEAHKAGYKTIADIGKERIRRVIKKIKDEQEKKKGLFSGEKPQPDLGFKVFKLQPSNFKLWDGDVAKDEEAIKKQIALFVEHINPQSSPEDILYEILLKSGFPLTTKIEKTVLAEKDVFSIADCSMLICLEKDLTPEIIKAMAEMKPVRVVCLDEGFKGNDQLKTNAVQIMKTRNITFRTV